MFDSTSNCSKNEHFLPPDTHTYVFVSGGKKYSFFGKFGVLCFFETPVLRLALLPYYRRFMSMDLSFFFRGNNDEAIRLFEKAIDLVRTQTEMANTFSLLEASKAQSKITKQYGITLPTMPQGIM